MLLLDLPNEVLDQIFLSVEDFTALNALARTSRTLHNVQRAKFASIFHSVARHALPGFDDAERLVDAQEKSSAAKHENTVQLPFRNERFLLNARFASAACKHWDEICRVECFPDYRGDNPSLRPSERARFKRSFYHLWTICTLANCPDLQPMALEFLDTCNPTELAGIDEISDWASAFNENTFEVSGLDFKDGSWDKGCEMVGKYCAWEREDKSDHRRIPVSGQEAPLGFWVFFDHTQRYLRQIRRSGSAFRGEEYTY